MKDPYTIIIRPLLTEKNLIAKDRRKSDRSHVVL